MGVEKIIAKGSGVLVYHAVFERIPADLDGGLHNVTPTHLSGQFQAIRRAGLTFVPLDMWLAASPLDRESRVAVTFDDAYACVFTNAWPILQAAQIPATIFVNASTLEGRVFWRDKVRALIARGLVEAFLRALPPGHPLGAVAPHRFYKASKEPGIASAVVDEALDDFLTAHGISLGTYCITSPGQLVHHPLIQYGNHSFRHYVLSSLTREAQALEIDVNAAALEALNVPVSRCFALPFGGPETFTRETIELLKARRYSGVLLAGNGTWEDYQAPSAPQSAAGLKLAPRYMPADLAAS